VELAGGASVWAIGKPEVKDSQLLLRHYPDSTLMSVRTTDVKRIVAASKPGESTGLTAAEGASSARSATQGTGTRGADAAGLQKSGGGVAGSGPLTFDTTWYDWGPYAAEMVSRTKTHWDVPDIARLNLKGKVVLRFYIRADGRVEGASIISHSGVPRFDEAALKAVLTSSPFRPLPKELGHDREGVTLTFYYNIRPEESGGGPKK
jgi:TonB family protein